MAAGAVGRDGNKDLALIGDSALQLFLQSQGRARHASRGTQPTLLEQINCPLSLILPALLGNTTKLSPVLPVIRTLPSGGSNWVLIGTFARIPPRAILSLTS